MGLMTHSGDKGDGRSCDDETLTLSLIHISAAGTSESKSDSAQTTGANNAEQRWSFEIAPEDVYKRQSVYRVRGAQCKERRL